MFKDLMDFSVKRTAVQAIGFYLFYLLMSMLIGGLSGLILGSIGSSMDTIFTGSILLAMLFSVVLYYTIYFNKNLQSPILLLLGLIVGFVTYFFGTLVSLIIVSFLTTRENTEELMIEEV